MFDTRKIDSFFDGEKQIKRNFEETSSVSKWSRFVKLGFPCIAAALLGVMVVIPNIKKSVDLQDNITMPRKNELEKLHIEETVFSAIDDKNRVNTVVADSVDEVEPGSQKVKFKNPKGQIPTDDGNIDITADIGYFTQQENVLELENNVKAVVHEKTTIHTERVVYDFNNEFGYGKEPIEAVGDWGTLKAPEFTFDKKSDILTLIGYHEITSQKGVLTAEKETKVFQRENRTESLGNAVLQQENNKVRADKIIAFFTDKSHKELKRIEAYGNVIITTPTEYATGKEGYFEAETGKLELFGENGIVLIKRENNTLQAKHVIAHFTKGKKQELIKVEALQNVVVKTPKGSASGNKGIYNPRTKLVELLGDVRIEQDGNFVVGQRAETDLNTSVSRLKGGEKTGGRISGIFYNKRKNKNGSDTKK